MKKQNLFLVISIIFVVFLLTTGCGGSPTAPPLTYTVGDTGPAGGLIFYDKGSDSDGWRYLEAAPVSTEWEKPWGSLENDFYGETETSIGSGQNNTTIIVTWLNSHSETGKAAQLCNDLIVGGYNDWFLPSRGELNLIYTNLKVAGVGGFADDNYWSSSEIDTDYAWAQYFYNGSQYTEWKANANYRVRAVRSF